MAPDFAQAQVNIVTPYPGPAGNLTRGSVDTSLLTVQITFGNACSNVFSTVTLPSGVHYVPGTVAKTAGTPSAAIAYSSGTASAPVFSITGITGPGDITFTIRRTALCGTTGAGKDVVSVTGSCGSFTENNVNINSYTIYAPSLSLTPPASITNANVGANSARSTAITNGGNGCLDTYYYYEVLPSGRLALADSPANTLMVSLSGGALPAAAFTPYTRNGDTLFYKIYGANAFGNDGLLCNGEIVNIAESVSVKACGSYTTYHGAFWGRNSSNCQGATGSSVITTANTAATFTARTVMSPALSACIASVYTINDTLTNTGSVPVYYNRFTLTNSQASSNSYIDTGSIMVGVLGGAAYHPAGGFTVNSTNANTLACIVGKPQNITYQFPAEFILPVGGRIVVSYNVMSGCRDSSSCAATYTAASYTVNHLYHLFCNAAIVTRASNAQAIGYTMRMGSFTFQTPAVVPHKGVFSVKVPVSFTTPTTPASLLTRRLGEVSLTVPAGISLVSAGELLDTGATVYTIVSGNTISYRFIPNIATRSHYVVFNLRNDSACGYQPLIARASVVLDSTCSSDTRLTASSCYTNTTKYKCPPGAGASCPGITGLTFSFARSSYGLPDNNQDGRPDSTGVLDFSKVDPDRYMVGDTLRSLSSGTIAARGVAPLDTFAYVYAEWNFPVGVWAPAGNATITVKRGSATYTCSNVAITSLTAGRIFRADWKSSPCMAGFTSYRAGDSIVVSADFRLSDATYYTPTGLPGETGGRNNSYDYTRDAVSKLTHLLYATDNTNPATGGSIGGAVARPGFACDTALYNAYLTGWRHTLSSTTATATGCATVSKSFVSQSSTANAAAGGQYFTAEYRPIAVPDTFIVTLPTGWDYVAPLTSSMTYTTRKGSSTAINYMIAPTVSADASGRVQLLFDYKSALQNGTIPFIGTEGVAFTTSYSVRPSSCATPTNSKDSLVEYGHLNNPFGVSFSRYVLHSTPANNMVYSTRPALTVSNTTGTVNANAAGNYWDIQVNTNSVAASNIWLALEKASGNVTVDSVAYLNASGTATTGKLNAAAAPSTYTNNGNQWYQVTSGIAANSNQKLRVYFRYGNCLADSIKAYAGFDCNGYPSSPLSPACSSTASPAIFLNVASKPSEIQLSISRQPGNGSAIGLCSTDSVTFIVNSAQPANILNPKVQIILPSGMTVITPFPVEYPLGSNNWQNITPSPISGGYEVDLSGHTGIGSAGIKGTALNPAAAGRQAKVKVAFNTGCSYRAGSNVVMYGYANRTCGNPATGDGSNVKSLPLDIIGVPTSGGTINMAMSLPVTNIYCGSTATLALVTTPLGGSTQANDSIIYTLPSGIGYAGNFMADSNCTGCTATASPGILPGTTYVKVKLPPSIAANTGIGYRFDISGTGSDCGSATIEANAVRTYPGIYCGATLCSTSERIVGNSASGTINRIKPELVVSGMSINSGQFSPGQTVNLKLDYRNNGGMAAAANTYQVEFYRSGSLIPFAFRTLKQPMAINAAASDTFNVYMPDSATSGEIISVKLQTVTSQATAQCLCVNSMASIVTALPVKLISFKARLEGSRSVRLDWHVASETGISSYIIERSTDGRHFTAIGAVAAVNNPDGAAQYTEADLSLPAAEKIMYRLRIAEQDGHFSFSAIASVLQKLQPAVLQVVPNPTFGDAAVHWTSNSNAHVRMQIFNSIGSCIHQEVISVVAGQNKLPLSVKGVQPGEYMLKVTDDGGISTTARFTLIR